MPCAGSLEQIYVRGPVVSKIGPDADPRHHPTAKPRQGQDNRRRTTAINFEGRKRVEANATPAPLGPITFTPREDRNDLTGMVRDAVLCHFDADKLP